MYKFLLDSVLIRSMMFFPRSASAGTSLLPYAHDGVFELDEVEIGYRLYVKDKASALLLYFHGNGETAADYDQVAPLYREEGLSLLVVEYRGYGWSTGRPRGSALLPDAEGVMDRLPQVLEKHDLADAPLFLMGRSLGSAPAVHLAYQYPERFKGLILESGFAHGPSVLLPVLRRMRGPYENARKMAEIALPLLVIHGERDRVIPVTQGQQLYDSSPAELKTLLRIPNAGHNDLLFRAMTRYFTAVKQFVYDALHSPP